jgi:putative FmdB family regulatory protein
MILYEYRCDDCGWITEARRSVADRDNAPLCEKCGKITQRVFSLRAHLVVPRAFQLECAREAAKLVLPSTPEEKRYWDTFGIVEDDEE